NTLCAAITTVVASVTVAGDPRGVPSYNLRSCSAPVNNAHIPSGGLSDVEPRLFTNADTSAISSSSANSLIFGFAVNEKLYRALQAMEGLDSTTTTADTNLSSTFTGTASVAVRDNEANMPSLSKETLSAIFAGNMPSWTFLRGPAGQSLAASTSGDMNVYVARRVPSSGTQKSTEMFLFGGITPTDGSTLTKCNPTAPAMVASNGTGAPDVASIVCTATVSPQLVFQGNGSGDVRNCLNFKDTANRYAIGILSTETPFTSADGNNETDKTQRFIKVDGQAPSMVNAATGRYKHWVEQSLNKPAYFGTLGAGEQAGVNAVFTEMGGAPGLTVALNSVFNHRWGQGTLLSLGLSGAAPTDPSPGGLTQTKMIANPVNAYSKSANGGPDSCLPSQFVGAGTTPNVGGQQNPQQVSASHSQGPHRKVGPFFWNVTELQQSPLRALLWSPQTTRVNPVALFLRRLADRGGERHCARARRMGAAARAAGLARLRHPPVPGRRQQRALAARDRARGLSASGREAPHPGRGERACGAGEGLPRRRLRHRGGGRAGAEGRRRRRDPEGHRGTRRARRRARLALLLARAHRRTGAGARGGRSAFLSRRAGRHQSPEPLGRPARHAGAARGHGAGHHAHRAESRRQAAAARGGGAEQPLQPEHHAFAAVGKPALRQPVPARARRRNSIPDLARGYQRGARAAAQLFDSAAAERRHAVW